LNALIIVPTFNEIENISILIPEILKHNPDVHILVVDDNSPDKTGAAVKAMQKSLPQLHLLEREGKQGLGKAYLAGFEWGLALKFDAFIEMDADFSHRPFDLKLILHALRTHDFVVGSRYVSGGKTVNWGLMRKFISRGGGIYSRLILGFPLNDWTGGFNGWNRHVLEKMQLDLIKSNGYSFQIELKYRAMLLNFSCTEVPIVFEDRRVGQSKMSLKIVLEAFYRVWMLKFS
jgi:dolichol-phosphate mannosyltransferase